MRFFCPKLTHDFVRKYTSNSKAWHMDGKCHTLIFPVLEPLISRSSVGVKDMQTISLS